MLNFHLRKTKSLSQSQLIYPAYVPPDSHEPLLDETEKDVQALISPVALSKCILISALKAAIIGN